MTSNEIRDRLITLRAKKDEVDLLLAEAKISAKQEGIFAAVAEYGSWLKMSKHYGREISKLSVDLSAKLKEERISLAHEENKRFERRFMWNAKKLLPEETYLAIMRMTAEEQPANGQP